MRRALLSSFLLLSACSAGAPHDGSAPVASINVGAPETTEKPSAASDAPLESVEVTETHRYFVATSTYELPMLDPNAVAKRVPGALKGKFDAIVRRHASYTQARKDALAADYAAMGCAMAEKPAQQCSALDVKASKARDKADGELTQFGQASVELLAALDDSPGAMLANAWLEDAMADQDREEPLYDQSKKSGFTLGESAWSSVMGAAYVQAAKGIPASDSLGVVVRLRAAVDLLVDGDADEAIALLDQAKSVAKGAEATEVWFLLGQAHALRAMDAKETARALEEALKSADSARVSKHDVGVALALAAYRASNFPRALEIALDVQAGRMEPAGTIKQWQAGAGLLATLGRMDSTTEDLLELEVGAIEHIGIGRADLAKASAEEATRIHEELALRAIYVGDLATATDIVRAHPPGKGQSSSNAMRALCVHGVSTSASGCPKEIPPPMESGDGSFTISADVLEGAWTLGAPYERAATELSRLCVEPELAWFLAHEKGGGGELRLTVEITPSKPVQVQVRASGDNEGLAPVKACIEKLAPVRFEKSTHRIAATIDLTHAGKRPDTGGMAAGPLFETGTAGSTIGKRGVGGAGGQAGGKSTKPRP